MCENRLLAGTLVPLTLAFDLALSLMQEKENPGMAEARTAIRKTCGLSVGSPTALAVRVKETGRESRTAPRTIAAAGLLIALLAFWISPAAAAVGCGNGAAYALDTRSVGACCDADGSCRPVLPDSCQAQSTWQGVGSICSPSPCSPNTPLQVPAHDTLPTGRYLVASCPVRLTPGTRLSTVLSDLGPPGPYTWRGFGMVTGTWVEDPFLWGGQAFILCTNVAGQPTFSGFPQPDAVTVSLTPGWNLVGCLDSGAGFYPWSACTVIRGGVESPFRDQSQVIQEVRWYEDGTGDLFNNGLWEPLSGDALFSSGAVGANPWGGYLVSATDSCQMVFHRQSAPRPTAAGTSNRSGDRAASSREWSLQLYAEADSTRDGWLELGVQGGAAAGRGDLDLPKPPAFGDGVALSIVRDSPDGGPSKLLLSDFQGAGEDSYTWDLAVGYAGNRRSDGPVRLVWRDATGIPAEWSVYLLAGESGAIDGRAVDMRGTDHCDLRLDKGSSRHVSVRVSKDPLPDELIAGGRARIVSLSPSPAVADVTVDFQIGDPGVATLGVFDVQGRLVARLVSGPLEGGQYTRTWSPAQSGVPSGIYFVKLRTPGGEDTRRVAVIRG